MTPSLARFRAPVLSRPPGCPPHGPQVSIQHGDVASGDPGVSVVSGVARNGPGALGSPDLRH